MAETRLSQVEADELIQLRKHRLNDDLWRYPSLGGKVTVPLQAVSKPSKERAQLLAFAITDTREMRPQASSAYALLNDVENKVSESVISALKAYDVNPVLWTKRDEFISTLAA